MTPIQQRGYDDQSSGMLNAALAEADTPAGREYRDGMRAAKRDAQDWLPLDEVPTNGTPVEVRLDPLTIVVARLTEGQWEAKTRIQGEKKSVWHKILPPLAWRPYAFDPVPSTEHELPPVTPTPTPSMYSEPDPTAKRRKAKPVDDAQASLF